MCVNQSCVVQLELPAGGMVIPNLCRGEVKMRNDAALAVESSDDKLARARDLFDVEVTFSWWIIDDMKVSCVGCEYVRLMVGQAGWN